MNKESDLAWLKTMQQANAAKLSPIKRELKHTHKYTIPVEWRHAREFFPTDNKGHGYYGKMYQKVTKLRCECGKESKRG
jgi:hypothetical protein